MGRIQPAGQGDLRGGRLNFADLAALETDEEKQPKVLRSDGRIGAHHVAPARRAVFLEVKTADQDQVVKTLTSLHLPSSSISIYPTAPPDTTGVDLRTQSWVGMSLSWQRRSAK